MRISDWSSDVCSSDLDKIAGAAKLKERLDAARLELDQAQRGGDLARAGELSYGTIPQLQKQLADAEGATKRSEEHTSELQSLMRISYAVFCLKKKERNKIHLKSQIHTTHSQYTSHQHKQA